MVCSLLSLCFCLCFVFLPFIGSCLSFLLKSYFLSFMSFVLFYFVLSSAIFISASTLCLEVRLCGLLSVVLLLMLMLLSFSLLFWSLNSIFGSSLFCLEFWSFMSVLFQVGL